MLHRLRQRISQPRIAANRSDRSSDALFIVGSGRSGTTLLRRLLMEAADIYIPPETYVLGQVIRQSRACSRMSWADLVAYVVGRFDYEAEFHHFHISTLRPFALEMTKAPPEARNLESLLDALYRHFATQAGFDCAFWGDKTPYNTYFLPEIAATFPQASFIGMQRDGCDVVVSYISAGLYGTYEEAARRWIESNRLLDRFAKKASGRLEFVRYESLITDTEVVIDRIARFARLPPRREDRTTAGHSMQDAAALSHLKKSLAPVDPTNTGRGLAILRKNGSDALRRLMNPELSRLGYEPL